MQTRPARNPKTAFWDVWDKFEAEVGSSGLRCEHLANNREVCFVGRDGKGKGICIEQAASNHPAMSTHLAYIIGLNSLAITSFPVPVSNTSECSSHASECCPLNLRNSHLKRQGIPIALRMEITLHNTSLKSPHYVVPLTFLTHLIPTRFPSPWLMLIQGFHLLQVLAVSFAQGFISPGSLWLALYPSALCSGDILSNVKVFSIAFSKVYLQPYPSTQCDVPRAPLCLSLLEA